MTSPTRSGGRTGDSVPAGASRERVAASIAWVAVALEVIDSRIADWRIAVQDTVADNASSAYAVVGWPVPAQDVDDLSTVGLALRRNGEIVATGAGAAVLGDPVLALTWLAIGSPSRASSCGRARSSCPERCTPPYPSPRVTC